MADVVGSRRVVGAVEDGPPGFLTPAAEDEQAIAFRFRDAAKFVTLLIGPQYFVCIGTVSLDVETGGTILRAGCAMRELAGLTTPLRDSADDRTEDAAEAVDGSSIVPWGFSVSLWPCWTIGSGVGHIRSSQVLRAHKV